MSATVNMAEEEALCPVCGCLLEEDGAFATVRQPCGCIACRPCATTLLSISLSESAQDPRCMLCHGALPDLAGRGSEGVGAFVDTLPTGAPNAAHQEQVQFLGELPSGALSELGQCIGNGGAGAIFEATLLVNGAQVPVAVKVIHRRTSEDWRRERREVSMASLVSQRCSRVCRVYGYTQQNDALLMVMERCQRSLADRLAELGGRGLPQGELARVAVDLCTSLAQLHACDVVHCDIKPGNCLVRADGTVVLADFGGSKSVNHSVRSTWYATASYACLSQLKVVEARRTRAVKAWDIHSWAATMTHLASGRQPFDKVAPALVATEHIGGRTLEHMHLDVVPDGLRPVLLRCLAQDTQQTPQQQTPSAVELLEEVRQWASSMGAL